MLIDKLQAKHPVLHYRGFKLEQETGDLIRLRYDFFLEPDISFSPELLLPFPSGTDLTALEALFFNLGMVELISYWKAACPPLVQVHAGPLSEAQLHWWRDLFIHGLGEFYYINGIDFTAPDFVTIRAEADAAPRKAVKFSPEPNSSLVLVGGGKDSTVTLELLRSAGEAKRSALLLNPIRASLDSARLAGYTNPVVVRRTIDPRLLQLNAEGYLNGHTPFSAYLAFLSTLMAAAYGFERIVASNEASSNEPNLMLHGLPVNHQYSKSVRFEERFRLYAAQWLTADIEYYSFLRPLHELQISKLFARYPHHFHSFRSCNVLQQRGSWCGSCPKCVFVWLSLLPFVPKHELDAIFGADLLTLPQNEAILRDLVGLGKHKPFECVGTTGEAALALQLAVERFQEEGREPPARFMTLLQELETAGNIADDSLLYSWNEEHFLPEDEERLLREAVLHGD